MKEAFKILVVDDNRELADIMQELLHDEGYEASVAYDGKSAIGMFGKESFDLAILDFKLPDMNSLRLQEQLVEKTDADFIIITAYASIESAADAVRQKRIVGYESKPLDMAHLLAFIQQLAERRQAEKELEQANARLRAVFEAIPGHIIAVDREYNLLASNDLPNVVSDKGITDKKEVIGHKCYKIFKGKTSVCPDCSIERCLKSGRLQTRLSTPEEDSFYGISRKLYAAPIKDRHGEITGAVECAMDITDMKKMETELMKSAELYESSFQTKNDFIYNTGCEIQEPVNEIKCLASVLKDASLSSEQKNIINSISDLSDALLSISTDIIKYSKIESGKTDYKEEVFNLEKMIRHVIGLVSAKIKSRSVRTGYNIDASVGHNLCGDAGLLQQILLNLVGNAIRFTEEGDIRIFVSPEQDTDNHILLRFSVQDTGTGFAPERMSDLFTPFSLADIPGAAKFRGTGLELAISRKLVELMGGDIGADSEPGTGSTFWFTMMLKKAD